MASVACYHGPRMVIDAHTHIFPPNLIARRAELALREPGFAAIYGDPSATMATAEDLISSMDAGAIDQSWAMGFAWRDPDLCEGHAAYLAESACRFPGRIVPFVPINPAHAERAIRQVRANPRVAAGVGELRPADQGYSLDDPAAREVFDGVREAGLIAVFHVSEPVGHHYAGKAGLTIDEFARFATWFQPGRTVAAHWGGGLPWYALMPEVREALRQTWFDTAASPLLYDPRVYGTVGALVGFDRILSASDFPLLSQAKQVARAREALGPREATLALTENATALLTGSGYPPAGSP